ncbi:MAG: hypothetical protein Q9N34_02915 [Aquificota bacterium]|nr:hypothetical protein [Aquificota bacterium]
MGGVRIGSETPSGEGFLLSGGIRFTGDMFKGGVEVYGGTINYDGQTQAGEPVKTDTEYRGVSLRAGLRREIGETVRLAGNFSTTQSSGLGI